MRPIQGKTQVLRSGIHGYGVFARKDIRPWEVVERMPALAIRDDHISAKGHKDEHCPLSTHAYHPMFLHEVWIGTGTSSFYNSADDANAQFEFEWEEGDWICIVATRAIKRGEEVTLNYLQDENS